MEFQFSIPSSIAFGEGCAQSVDHIVMGMELTRVFCIYDQGVKKAGIAAGIVKCLQNAGLEVVEWDGVASNLTDVLVEEGTRLAREAEAQVVVAVGGGSVIDAGKAICVLLTSESPIKQYEGMNMVKTPAAPLVAIPTTAGSASEVTAFATVTDTVKMKNMVFGGQFIGPKYALIDPLLTVSVPPALTASTGMDALTHAVEAYLSQAASIPTDINALKAVGLIGTSLAEAVANGKNVETRANMLLGSMLAGFAFNSAMLGLSHSIAHALGVHCGIPHGVANAAVLPHTLEYNAEAVPERVRDIGLALGLDVGGLSAPQAARETVSAVRALSGKIGIPTLKEAGVSRDQFELVAKDALQEVSTIFNPRDPNKEDVLKILEKAY